MNRRTVLTAALSAPAVALAGSLPVVAALETPVMALFREWRVLSDILAATSSSHLDYDALLDRKIALVDRMLGIPAEDARDFLVKVVAYTCHGEGDLPGLRTNPAFWAEARALVA